MVKGDRATTTTQEKVEEAIALLISQPVVKQECDRLRWSKAITLQILAKQGKVIEAIALQTLVKQEKAQEAIALSIIQRRSPYNYYRGESRRSDRTPDRLRWSKAIALQILVKHEKVEEAIALQTLVKQEKAQEAIALSIIQRRSRLSPFQKAISLESREHLKYAKI